MLVLLEIFILVDYLQGRIHDRRGLSRPAHKVNNTKGQWEIFTFFASIVILEIFLQF